MSPIDVVEIPPDRWVLVSENRLNFVSGISRDALPAVLAEEQRVTGEGSASSLPVGACGIGPSIAFMPTLDCNLRCTYCYSRGGDDKIYLTPQAARTAVDAIAAGRPDTRSETLAMYFVGGGEPFQNFTLMEDVCAYAKTKFADVDVILVTNGVLGERQRQWLVDNHVTTRVSYDGLAQDAQRRTPDGDSVSHAVEETIRYLLAADVPLTVQMTVTSGSVPRMAESVQHIARLGVKYVKIEPTHSSVLSRGDVSLVPDPEVFVDSFIATVKAILRSDLTMKIDHSFFSRPTSGYYCGAGDGSNKTVTPFGSITSCLEVVRPTDAFAEVMIYGEYTGTGFKIDETKRRVLDQLHWRNYRECPSCNLKLICGGGCPMQGGWDNGDLMTPSAYNCWIHKQLLPRLFEMVFEDSRVLDVICDNHVVSRAC